MFSQTLVLIAALTLQGVPRVPTDAAVIVPGVHAWKGAATSAPSGPAIDGLAAAITASPKTVRHGQTMKFAIEMRNVSQATLYYWPVHYDNIQFSVVNIATGSVLPEHRRPFPEAYSYRNNGNPLEPNTSAYKEMNLSDDFDLLPGSYSVSVAFSVYGTGQLQKPVHLHSNTITIRVLP